MPNEVRTGTGLGQRNTKTCKWSKRRPSVVEQEVELGSGDSFIGKSLNIWHIIPLVLQASDLFFTCLNSPRFLERCPYEKIMSTSKLDQGFDYIVVGAGSAGCVLANRLSADPGVQVLLVEAGGVDSLRDLLPWIHVPVGYFKTIHLRVGICQPY